MRAAFVRTTAAIAFAVTLFACGTEVGRVAFGGEGSASAPMTLKAGEVAFWTDIDIDYKGDAALAYRIELAQDGATVATATCDPLGHMSAKVSWVETNIGSSHSRRGNGKMGCATTLAKAGPTTLKATLAFATKPAELTLKKADLVVKQ